jgi:hypothetical protein
MNLNEHYRNHQPDQTWEWPLVLTPELRQQLIQEKFRRVREFVKLRDQPMHTCHETHCECN